MTLLDGLTCPTALVVILLLCCCYVAFVLYKGFVETISGYLKEQTNREAQRWREEMDRRHEAWDQ